MCKNFMRLKVINHVSSSKTLVVKITMRDPRRILSKIINGLKQLQLEDF